MPNVCLLLPKHPAYPVRCRRQCQTSSTTTAGACYTPGLWAWPALGGAAVDDRHVYAVPRELRLNQWALSGTVTQRAAALNMPNGRIAYRFHARDVNLIMGPVTRGIPARYRVFVDGRPPAAAHGGDADEQGNGTVTEQRMYQLIRQPKPITDRQFEIEFTMRASKRSVSRSRDPGS